MKPSGLYTLPDTIHPIEVRGVTISNIAVHKSPVRIEVDRRERGGSDYQVPHALEISAHFEARLSKLVTWKFVYRSWLSILPSILGHECLPEEMALHVLRQRPLDAVCEDA